MAEFVIELLELLFECKFILEVLDVEVGAATVEVVAMPHRLVRLVRGVSSDLTPTQLLPFRNEVRSLLLLLALSLGVDSHCVASAIAAARGVELDMPPLPGVAAVVGADAFVDFVLFVVTLAVAVASIVVAAAVVDVVVVDGVVIVVVVTGVANISIPIFGMPPLMRGRLLRQTDMLQFSEILTFGKLCTFGFELKQAVESNDFMR